MGGLSYKAVFVDREVLYEELTQRILKKLEHIPFYVLEDGDSIHIGEGYDELISTSKVYLHVAKQKGAFVKRCPGTKYHICCGYHILNVGMNCNFDCSYCFLQFYINSPVTTLYTNLGDLAHEVDQYLENSSEHILRFGTGEFTDSLSLDNVTDLSRDLLALFSHRQCIVELKTKSTNVKNLVSDTANPNFVISWSVNPERIIRDEEHYTASLKERLRAARFCQEAGYLVGLHFDPIIHYPGWEEDYQGVVDDIYHLLIREKIAWISLGSLRFHPYLKGVMKKRFSETKIIYGEFIKGEDGKFRYIKDIRIELYNLLLKSIQEYDRNGFVYLCMERDDVWRRVFGFSPREYGSLEKMFDERVKTFTSILS